MNIEIPVALWPDDQAPLSLGELIERSGLSEMELRELIDCGLLVPLAQANAGETFHAECLVLIHRAQRLRHAFDLNAEGLALVLSLLERVRGLQNELCQLRACLPQRF